MDPIRVTRILKALGVFVGAVGIAAFLLVSMLLMAFAPEATPEPSNNLVRPVVPKVKTCHTIPASKWNHLLRVNRRVTGRPINRKRIKNRPVCVSHYRKLKRTVQKRKRRLARKLATNARVAIPKAFSDAGIGWRTSEALRVAWCESRYNRFARNSGGYSGLFQLSYAHQARMRGDWFNAYANAYHAAITVRADGGWRQWECRP